MGCKGHCGCAAIGKVARGKDTINTGDNLARRLYRVSFQTSDGIRQNMDILATSEEDASLKVRTEFSGSTIFTCVEVIAQA